MGGYSLVSFGLPVLLFLLANHYSRFARNELDKQPEMIKFVTSDMFTGSEKKDQSTHQKNLEHLEQQLKRTRLTLEQPREVREKAGQEDNEKVEQFIRL
mmetsp:Transcript_13102/g.25391  ORF Transcript_13102/g.25391 Transcript_13102/m.25391 type:complete len:99 (-) Transcript_13102:22-318(-)